MVTSNLLTFFGQFMDHDLTFSQDTNDTGPVCNSFPIPIPKGDNFYDSGFTGTQTMRFCRLSLAAGTGTGTGNPANFPNIITSWIDASTVYGYTNDRTQALRAFKGGLMKTSPGVDGDYLPINDNGQGGQLVQMANAQNKVPATQLYAAGDMRADENPVLLSIHTMWVREHNRRANLLPSSMTDEQIFQQARKMVIAHVQHIVFYEFLPTILGQQMPAYAGYDPTKNPGIFDFFSTVAYRFGHDMLSDVLSRLDPYGNDIPAGSVLLRDAFFDIASFTTFGVSVFLRGAAVHPQRQVDCVLEDDIRVFLYGKGPATAFDLAARNMQRARDVGLGFYNDFRAAYNLPTCNTFDCVTNDTSAIAALNNAYGTNNVSFLDPFVGGLLEQKNTPTALLGALFSTAIIEQFSNIRNGDRFWFENPGVLTASELSEIQTTKFSDIIKRNTDSVLVPGDVFNRQNLSPTEVYNPVDNTGWIIAIVILTVVAAILIVVVIGLCVSRGTSSRRVDDNQLYSSLVNDK